MTTLLAELEAQRGPAVALWSVATTDTSAWLVRTRWTRQAGAWTPHPEHYAMVAVDVRDPVSFAARAFVVALVFHQSTTSN